MYIQYVIPYLLFISIIFIYTLDGNIFFEKNNLYKSVRILFITNFIFISLYFIGCRGFVAADWYFYLPYFDSAPLLVDGWNKIYEFLRFSQWEIGYASLNILLKSFCNNYLGFQFLCFFIDLCILHSFFKRYCGRYYFLGWFLFWIFQGFVFEIIILRNTKSILLFLVSLKYVEQRRPFKYFIINLLGMCFHSSSIFYLPLYFFFFMKRRKKVELLLFLIGVCVYLFQIPFFKPLLSNLSSFVPGRYGYLLTHYLNSELYSGSYGLTLGFIERFMTFCLFYKNLDKIIRNENNLYIFWVLFLFYSFSYLYLSDFTILIGRIPNLFICSYWILYTRIFGYLKKDFKYLFLFLLLLYGIVRTTTLMNQPWAYYDNFLSGAIDASQRILLYSQNGYN